MECDTILLTPAETVEAICRDFRQYPPQLMLFSGLIRIITQNRVKFIKEGRRPGFWVSQPRQRNMHWAEGRELVAYMCREISRSDMDLETLVQVCRRVFRAHAEVITEDGSRCIKIATGMEIFDCIQCGHCCRSLDYHTEITEADVRRWQDLGRDDILKWVGGRRKNGAASGYRIWITPGTSQVADICPFLTSVPGKNHWQCAIQNAKPQICRQYPATRKHGLMTGCRGFSA
ncbi:MAG: YkgJ family cysteine cluster protein [Desulfobacterales bacterium]